MISVIIPLYNKEKRITQTLRSVLSQTYNDFEIVIVDDGSTDGSVAEVEKFHDSRIRLIRQENAGVSAARNRGVKEARGKYVAFIDADDEWKPEYLEYQYQLTLDFPECKVFASNYVFCDVQGVVSPTILNKLPFKGETGLLVNYFEVAAASHPPIWTSAVMIDRETFMETGGFPVGIKSGEDLLTWARLACRNKIAFSRRALAVFNAEGYDAREKPKRLPAEIDIVGRELVELLKEYKTPYLREYIALWHKMRSSIYMRLRMRRKSVKEALIGLRYNPLNLKLYVFVLLNCLPSKLQPF